MLSEHPNIIAIKESSGSLEKVMQMIREVKPGFQVLVGSAPTLAASFHVGAVGAVLAFANAAPYACITIWEAHRSRELEAAKDWQNRIAKAAQLVTTKYGVPGLKHAMDLMGYYGGPPRLPLLRHLPKRSGRLKLPSPASADKCTRQRISGKIAPKFSASSCVPIHSPPWLRTHRPAWMPI